MFETIGFWVFAVLSVSAALGVVFHRSLIYAALMLIVVFLSIAAIFVLNNADFLAIAQTIVYGVGLTIIVLFGIMFTGDRLLSDERKFSWQKLGFAGVSIGLLAILCQAIRYPFVIQAHPPELIATLKLEGTTRLLGEYLLQNQLLPFELSSVLLLIAMIGAILIAKKRFVPIDPASKIGFPESFSPPSLKSKLTVNSASAGSKELQNV